MESASCISFLLNADSNSQLTQLPAFQAFQAGIKDRCEEQPVVVDLEEVGSYQVF